MGAEQQELKFLMTFDAETGSLKVVKQELEGAAAAASNAGDHAKGFGGKLAGLGELAKTVSVAAFFIDAIKSAAGASDALDDLHKTFQATIGTLVRDFEPAIKFVSQGLQGFLVTVQGIGGVVKAVFAGEFGKAAELAGDAIEAGGERARGATKQIEQDISKIIIEETRNRIFQAGVSAEQKLAIIKDGEARATAALKASAEFQILDEEKRKLALLDLQNAFNRQRLAAQQQIEMDINKIQKVALDEVLGTQADAMDEALKKLGLTNEERLQAIDNLEKEELAIITYAGEQKILKEDEVETARSKIRQQGARARRQISDREDAAAFTAEANKARAILAIESATGQKIVDLAFQAAEKGKLNAKEAARAIISTVAQSSAAQIMAHFATGAALEVATKGIVGLPLAAAMIAEGTALAATVAALGGAAVRSIHVPSAASGAGTGGAGAGTGGGSDLFAPQFPGEASATPTTGPRVVVNVQLLDGSLAPLAAKSIGEELAKQDRQEGR